MDGSCANNSSNAAVCGAYARCNRFISKVLWMKFKHCVAVGCSHVFGSDLPDVSYPFPSPSAWPQLVSDKLGITCDNISKIAAGNGALYRRTIIYLQHMLEKYNAEEILLLVQFSHQDRHELIHSDFQWCGDDFPYVTTRYRADPLIDKKTNSFIVDTIKTWMVTADDSYRMLSNLQSKLLLLLTAEKLGITTFWGEASDYKPIHLPQWATVADPKIGMDPWHIGYKEYASKYFEIKETAGIDCYQLKQQGPVFDAFSAAINEMINKTGTHQLHYEEFNNWVEWCKARNFSYLKQKWEAGDQKLRSENKIVMEENNKIRFGPGHYGSDAHQCFADLVVEQIKNTLT